MISLKKPFARTTIVAAVVAGFSASLLIAAPADATPALPTAALSSSNHASALQTADLGMGLNLITEIPDSVLVAGDESLRMWLAQSHGELLSGARADVVGCAAAIAFLIASTAIPAAKILKIKRLIDTLGGVSKAVKILWGASFKWEKIKALGGTAAALGAELLGISSVQQKCFA